MLNRLRAARRLPSPALIVALLALGVGLSGSALAGPIVRTAERLVGADQLQPHAVGARQLRRHAVGARQLKRDAVRSRQVKDGSLRPRDFKRGALSRGSAGPRGPRGAAGPRGPAGPLSRTLPSGMTLTGVFELGDLVDETDDSLNSVAYDSISFGFPLAQAPQVQVIRDGAATEQCPGSIAAPSAAPGHLCVYADEDSHVRAPGVQVFDPCCDGFEAASRYGAALVIQAITPGAGLFHAGGTWAVTAP